MGIKIKTDACGDIMITKTYNELPPILWNVKSYGFAIFEDGDYDLNIIGVRNIVDPKPNQFDDVLIVAYKLDGKWITEEAQITTDPGRYWLTKENYKPCAVYYHPQQARGAYVIRKHRGKYDALCQWRAVKFWRDGDKDEHAEYKGKVYKDLIVLNIHKSSSLPSGSQYVNKWSAGCQVFKYEKDFDRLMELAKLQIEHLNYRTFTYTLIPNIDGVKHGCND